MSAHLGPLTGAQAVHHGVADGAVAAQCVAADDSVFPRAQALDGALRGEVEVVGKSTSTGTCITFWPDFSIFEKIIIEKLLEENRKSLIIRGLPKDSKCVENKDNIDFLNHCSDSEFFHYISNAKIIICRSGYSSIMDMLVFNKNVKIIPTPGQPEQEYLAKRLNNKYNFISLQQEDLKNICLSQIDFQTKQSFENDKNKLNEFLNLHL